MDLRQFWRGIRGLRDKQEDLDVVSGHKPEKVREFSMRKKRSSFSRMPQPTDEEIAAFLQEFSKTTVLTGQRCFAECMGVDFKTLKSWMAGTSTPDADQKRDIAFWLRPLPFRR